MSRAYTNPLGVQLGPCTYCGFCEKFGCGNYSKASPQTTILPVLMRKKNFELRTECEVLKVNLDSDGKRATGVTYVDAQGSEFEQPAEIVILLRLRRCTMCSCCCCRASASPTTRRPAKAWSARTTPTRSSRGVDVFFDDKIFNPFIGAGALGMAIDDYNGDNFDHGGLGFIGGGYHRLLATPTAGRSRSTRRRRARRNGARKWKKAVAQELSATAARSRRMAR